MEVSKHIMQDLIDQLIISNQEAHSCLRTSAQAVADLDLRAQLQAYAKAHEEMTVELAALATALHLSACQRQLQAILPSMPGRSSFQYALVTKDRYAILAECQVRLRQTLECYEEIMGASLPESVSSVLASQSERIERAYHSIHHMCVRAQPQFTRHKISRGESKSTSMMTANNTPRRLPNLLPNSSGPMTTS